MASSDHDLLKRAVNVNGDALAALFEKHAPTVRRRLAGKIPRRFRSLLSVDDVMQEAYTDAIIDIRRFTPGSEDSFAAWLTQIALCNLKDALRMLKADKRGGDRKRIETRDIEGSLVALYDMVTGARTTPSQHAALKEACAAVRAAVQQLPKFFRQVVQMCDLEGRPYPKWLWR